MEGHRGPILVASDISKTAEPPPKFRRNKKISQPGQIFLGRDPDIVDTDQVLVQDKVREETVQDHFNRMNQNQQEEMNKQKMSYILREWSQVLTEGVTEIRSLRNLSQDISLKSGLRTPNCVIDRGIEQFRQAPATPSFQTQLNDSPDMVGTNQTPLLLSTDSPVISQVLIFKLQRRNRIKLQKLLRKNSKLLFKYMFLLKTQCALSPMHSSAFHKLLKFKKLNSMKLIKKICKLLKKFGLIDQNWLLKPVQTFQAYSAKLGLMLTANISGHKVCCTIDTDKTFTLIHSDCNKQSYI